MYMYMYRERERERERWRDLFQGSKAGGCSEHPLRRTEKILQI